MAYIIVSIHAFCISPCHNSTTKIICFLKVAFRPACAVIFLLSYVLWWSGNNSGWGLETTYVVLISVHVICNIIVFGKPLRTDLSNAFSAFELKFVLEHQMWPKSWIIVEATYYNMRIQIIWYCFFPTFTIVIINKSQKSWNFITLSTTATSRFSPFCSAWRLIISFAKWNFSLVMYTELSCNTEK